MSVAGGTNLELVMEVRNYLADELSQLGTLAVEVESETLLASEALEGVTTEGEIVVPPVYAVVHPKSPVGNFVLVKPVVRFDGGGRSFDSVIEVSVYAQNLVQNKDQSQPDLDSINSVTQVVEGLLQGVVVGNSVFTSLRTTLVSDREIGYFYNSIVCEVFNVK